MKKPVVANMLFVIVTMALGGCAGVTKVAEVKIAAKKTSLNLDVGARYINLYLAFRSPKPTSYVDGWVTNTGRNPLVTVFKSYADKRQAGIMDPATDRLPDEVERITIAPGEMKKFFRGPLFLLGISLPERERRTSVKLELILDEPPNEPYKGEVLGSFGGP
ncbi:hypothetical protein [Luteolibacter sp. Populi]|uniref:hypothetical protein n=1 Tax=Luteolibacter sp. Populi TaxID=3230487 RepID=UPI003466F1C0